MLGTTYPFMALKLLRQLIISSWAPLRAMQVCWMGDHGSKVYSHTANSHMSAGMLQDEASTSIAMVLLYHGGFHALQLQRVAHYMWESGNITSALRIQVALCMCA